MIYPPMGVSAGNRSFVLFDSLRATMSYVIRVMFFHDVAGLDILLAPKKPTLSAPTPKPYKRHKKQKK
jgi:hypothetical protein